MQKQKEKSEKVKAILKKSLDVFCYIMTALAVTLGIAMGINSCSGSNESKRIDPQQELVKGLVNRAYDPSDYSVYVSRYTAGHHDVDFAYLRPYYNIPTDLTAERRGEVRYNLWFGENDNPAYYYNGSDWVELRRFRIQFTDLPVAEGVTQYEYVLWRVYGYLPDNSIINFYTRTNMETSEGDVGAFAGGKLVLTTYSVDEVGWHAFFVESDKQTFTFNSAFNYNAPFGLQYNAVYGDNVGDGFWTGGGESAGVAWKDYRVGWFFSNGRLFDTIRWYCSAGSGVSVMIDGHIATLEYAGNWVYTMMYYVNSVENTSIIVNARDSVPYNAGNNRYYANTSTWQVPAYRYILLADQPSDNIVDVLASFNNNNAYDTGLTYGGGFADVFTLVGSAFTGLLPVLTLQILPSVTIGTLLFVPLVAILVFAIIRIIKK